MTDGEDTTYRAVLPIALLYTEGRTAVEGATRFQKLVFLGQQEYDFPSFYDYHADRFGPYSEGLATDLRWAIGQGYVERNVERNTVGNQKYVYSLKPEGIQYARSLLSEDRLEPLFETAVELKQEWNDNPLDFVLRYVYHHYEEYTTETELDTDRLFDPDAESQFLEPEGTADDDFLGPSPERVVEVNSSFEDLKPNN